MILKIDDMTLIKAKKIFQILSLIGLAGCLLVLLPQARDCIIRFGEDFIVHRPLVAPVWHDRILMWALTGVFFIFVLLLALYLPKNIHSLGYIFLYMFCIFYYGSFSFLSITLDKNRVNYDKRIYELEQFTKYIEPAETISIFGSFNESGDFFRAQYAFSPHEISYNNTNVNYLIGYSPAETIPGWYTISIVENFVLYGKENK